MLKYKEIFYDHVLVRRTVELFDDLSRFKMGFQQFRTESGKQDEIVNSK